MCPFCNSKDIRKKSKFGKYKVLQCKNCDLSFISPLLTDKEAKKIYSKSYFVNPQSSILGYSSYEQMESVLKKEASRKIKFITKFTKRKKLLDVGAGLGYFLQVAAKEGYKVSGNDISPFAADFNQKNLKIPFIRGPITENILPKNSFEIITAWDVFEHIPQIKPAFKNINSALKKNGYLFLTTPSTKSIDSVIFKKYWYGYKKIPEHLLFFSPVSITNVLNAAGFEVVKIQSWGFERDVEFLVKKLGLYIPGIDKILIFFLKLFKIQSLSIYLPLTDMIVVAKKIDD